MRIPKREDPEPYTPCEAHTWAPQGRDRHVCPICGAKGYARRRQGRHVNWGSRGGEIVAYVCPKCGGPTTWAKHPCPNCR